MIRRVAGLLLALLLYAAPVHAVALVQQQGLLAAASSVTITMPSSVTVGNLLVVWVSHFSSTTPTLGGNVTVSSWTLVGTSSIGAGSLTLWQYAGIVTGAGTTISSTEASSSYSYIIAAEFSGAPASVVLDGTAATGNSVSGGTHPTTPTYTSTNASDLIVGVSNIQGASDNATNVGGAWTDLAVVNTQLHAIYQVAATTGSFTPQWPSTGNTGWVAICGGIRVPAAAASNRNTVTVVQ